MASVGLIGAGVAWGPVASADTVPIDFSCSLAGATGTVTVPLGATAAPEPAVPGAPVALTVQAGTPSYPDFALTVNALTLSFGRPAGIAAITDVSFAGGNLTGSWVTTDAGVDVTFTGPVSSASAVLPTFTVTGTVDAGAGPAITWALPVSASALVDLAGTVAVADCLPPAGAAPLATTSVNPTSTTTSTTATTTTVPTTSTTTRPATPVISISDPTMIENLGPAYFTITLDRPAPASITVGYATANGTAIAGTDYTAKSGTVTFSKGQSSKTVSVSVRNDNIAEPTETFVMNLNLAGSTLDPALSHKLTGTASIGNDDTATFSGVDRAVNEGNTTRTITVNVRMTPSASPQSVTWATEDGTALAGSDYVAGSGALTFAPGETARSVTVTVLGDRVAEPAETFAIRLGTVTGTAVIGKPTATVTLNNDD